eukprot:jgi/Ulvmu1/11709/UM008_0120.1
MHTQVGARCHHSQEAHGRVCDRRRAALVALVASIVGARAPASPAISTSLQNQIDASQTSQTLTMKGVYEEQIVVSKPITLYAKPEEGATLQWRTTKPYQSTIKVIPGGQLRLENITIRHSSPSVANNYAVFVQGGDVQAYGCDICSSSGSGIGLEGGTITAESSKVHDCVGNGAVIAGSIDTGPVSEDDGVNDIRPKAHFVDCELSSNGGSGLIALDEAIVELESCSVSRNNKSGLELRDCDARLEGCTVTQNMQASILQKSVARLQLLDSRGKNIVQPAPSVSR